MNISMLIKLFFMSSQSFLQFIDFIHEFHIQIINFVLKNVN